MKIAVLSDIHGNLPALQAVLEDLERERQRASLVQRAAGWQVRQCAVAYDWAYALATGRMPPPPATITP